MPSFGLDIKTDKSLETTVKYAELAEKSVFDYIWLRDFSPPLDVNVISKMLSSQTRSVKFGILVSDTQAEFFVSGDASEIRELIGDRTVFAVGLSESKAFGDAAIVRMRKIIQDLREYWKNTPIYINTMNRPELLELAGEIANGALIPSPQKYFTCAVEQIDIGAQKEGRTLKDFVFGLWLPWGIGELGDVSRWKKWKLQEIRELVKPEVAHIVATSPSVVFERLDLSIEDVQRVKEAFHKKSNEATGFVNAEMVDTFSFIGSIWDCNKKILEFYELLGFPERRRKLQIIVGEPHGPNKIEAIRTVSNETIFAIRMPYG